MVHRIRYSANILIICFEAQDFLEYHIYKGGDNDSGSNGFEMTLKNRGSAEKNNK